MRLSCGALKKNSFLMSRESALKLALPCRQTLQRGGHGIERALDAIHAVEKWLRIKLAPGFELADAAAGTPPGDGKAQRADPEGLGRHEQRAEKKAGRIHPMSPRLVSGGPTRCAKAAAR
jgi:hypothetical protein